MKTANKTHVYKKLHKTILWTVLCFFITIGPVSTLRASIISYQKAKDGVYFTLDKGALKIIVWGPDIIEVKYSILDSLGTRQSLVIKEGLKPGSAYSVSEKGDEVVISTTKLKVKVNKTTHAVTYADLGGNVILAEDGVQGKSMSAAVIAGIDTYRCTTKYQSPADEALYGLGCHPEDTGSINYKGRNQTLAIKYMTGGIPVMLSNKGYGLLWDNYSASKFYGGEDGNTAYRYVSESGAMVDYFFFYGPYFDKIISLYRQTTGVAPMFGKWAFGLFQSQDRYMSQAEVLSVKDNYRNNKIPLDCIVQDWFYWEPNVMGSHEMNPKRYPDPKFMVDELHKANLHAMVSI